MITSELISYIEKQISKNVPKNIIISNLLGAGWYRKDIDEGFLKFENRTKIVVPEIINNKIEIFNEELPMAKEEKPEVIEREEIPPVKIWVPRAVSVTQKEKTEVSVSSLELESPLIIQEKIIQKNLETQKELIPNLIPKKSYNSFDSISVPKKAVQNINNSNINNQLTKNSFVKNLPQGAMLSSFKSDSLLVNKEDEELIIPKKRKFFKWIIFGIVLVLAAGMIWFFANGDTNFSLIKKDPKVLLLNNSDILASLKAYKTETNIEISSPSFSDITYGLLSGEAVSSLDKDSLSINIKGLINKKDNDLISDTLITAKGSILEENVISNIKNNGVDLFISASSFNQMLKEDNTSLDFIKINEKEMNLIPTLFNNKIESKLNKINIYNILEKGLASYINNETMEEYNRLINNAEVIEKGQESIKGINTYHYSINIDKQLLKKLFDKIIENFISDISKEEKDNLNLILGSSTINSFDVWVGKEDNNIYQYSITADIPLSKIIGFEDSSIGDNKIGIKWETTYFDFDETNKIDIPENFILMTDFFNTIVEKRIKNDVISFGKLASTLYKKEGVYGKNSNPNGSCMNPVSGSLFSPLGHVKKASEEISSISLLMKKILGEENENAHCYSDQKAWSFTFPILTDYSEKTEEIKYNFCVDSTGSNKELINPPVGVVCK